MLLGLVCGLAAYSVSSDSSIPLMDQYIAGSVLQRTEIMGAVPDCPF